MRLKRFLSSLPQPGLENPHCSQNGPPDSDLPVCWVSLDPSEDDPVKFLSYLIASVQTIWDDLGDSILSALRSPGSPPVDFLLNSWINELSEYSSDFVLILDDFHHIKNQEVLDLLSNFTDHQPHQLHLLIASRADLPISCSRLRARDDIGEIEFADMRFTIDESIAYLHGQLGDRITEQDARTQPAHRGLDCWPAHGSTFDAYM